MSQKLHYRLSIMSAKTHKRIRRGGKYPNLLVWRLALNLNQRDAAALLGLTQSTYGRLERGKIRPVGEDAKHIMSRTGVPLEVLVGVA